MSDLNNIERSLGRIEGKLDIMDTQLKELQRSHHDRMNRIDVEIHTIDTRLQSVEKKQYGIILIASFIATLVSLVPRFFKF